MHARSALFDVYGDLLPGRGNRAPVAGLVRLLGPVGIAAPAVRTAISRMVAQGWLEPVATERGRGYAATERAVRRLARAAERIYDRRPQPWDGSWQLALVTCSGSRTDRARLQRELTYLGYAELRPHTWLSPWPREELAEALARCGATAVLARATELDPAGTPLSCWDLEGLGRAYEEWLADAAASVARHLAAHEDPDEAAFAARFHLVHEWRKFLFTDPALPSELLPADWPGDRAAAYFTREADRLRESAERFVARALSPGAD
ncbi:PaaX family transcriptional regulator C-terminal domain-containing protein [Nocardioides solisilvae]|uniref:PaaX family transcriptional regulator n=1 Tax=Nocardioides solisilvae TaxID=1542435 RepID=UPI000D744F6A|nr:PaaX family transcriptional regulator C-terminal domain-containing protein [Nocardioides solisilvae]